MSWTLERCLRENPRLSRTDIDYLKEWHQKQPHFPPLTEVQFVTFLFVCDYSLERAKTCIDKFLTMRTHAPEMFANRDVLLPINKSQGAFTMVALLPKRDAGGNRVVGLGLQRADDLSDFAPARSAFLAIAMIDMLVREWPMCPGYTFIMDARNLQFAHIAKSPLPFLKKLLAYVQEATPLRKNVIHVINLNPVVDKVMTLIRPLLVPEIQKLLRFHSGAMEAFYEELPRDMLPHEFGGTCGSAVQYHEELLQRLVEKRDEVLDEGSLVVDESLRPGRAKSSSDVFGMEGSFKKLDID